MSENTYCPNCRKPIAQDDIFCRFCGVGLVKDKIKNQPDKDTPEVTTDYLLNKMKIEPYEWKISDEQKGFKDKHSTNNRLSLTIAFALFGAISYILTNSRFRSNLMLPAYYGDGTLMWNMPGFIITIVLMSVVGFIIGLVVDGQIKGKK